MIDRAGRESGNLEIVIDSARSGGRPTAHYYNPDRSDWEELDSIPTDDDEAPINPNRETMEEALAMIVQQMAQVLLQQ